MNKNSNIKRHLVKYKGEDWLALPYTTGRKVYVRLEQYMLYNEIAAKSKVNFSQLYVKSQIDSINGDVGIFNSLRSKFYPTSHVLPLQGGALAYDISGGRIFLQDIIIDPHYKYRQAKQASDKMKRAAGVYSVSKGRARWEPSDNESLKVDTKHIAVNGRASDIFEAATSMPDFIDHGYKPDTISDKRDASYSLFFNPASGMFESAFKSLKDITGIAGGTQTARKLAAVIKSIHREGKEINWTVHGSGNAIFKQALKIASNKMGVAGASKQTVFYANSTINLDWVDYHRRKAGMTLSHNAPLMNDFSLLQSVVAGNAISETLVSLRQISETRARGVKSSTSYGKVTTRALGRTGVAAICIGLPEFGLGYDKILGAVSWALGAITIAVSATPKINNRIIEGPSDVIDLVESKFRR